jgi:hypothetical protein
MSKYQYIGQAYQQGESKLELISFCADATDVWRWGGVPSKNERFHGGFQRALGARYRKIIDYFNNGQASPGAIVVAFRQDALKVTDLGYPASWTNKKSLTTSPKFVHIQFESDDISTLSLHELIVRVNSIIEARPGFPLVGDESSEEDIGKLDGISSEVEQEGMGEGAAETVDDDLDVGQSKLRSFYDFINDEGVLNKWLTEEDLKIEAIKSKVNLTSADKEYILLNASEKIRTILTSLLRPAMIVDGQHRISGANESEKDNILFTVCAIKDADWVEQVFQFVVLNKMAKPISKDFLTELLNTSLTNKEIGDIDKRLENIGIKNSDRKIHKYVNHDPRSPFYDLVAEAGEVIASSRGSKLSQQGMLTLAKRWKLIAGQGKTSEISCFIPYLNVKTVTDARKLWSDYETWMVLFFAFWTEIKDIYEPHQIWEKKEKFHLLYIVTLTALQDLFIKKKAGALVKINSLDDFRVQVRDFFVNVPPGFFQNWESTGLQSGSGWQDIENAITMLQNGERLTAVMKKSVLFK